MRYSRGYSRLRGPTAGLLAALLSAGVAGPALAQQSVDTDSLRQAYQQQVADYASRVEQAASVFLDTARSESERLQAVQDIAVLNRPEDLERAAAIVLDAGQPVAIRVRAVQLAGHAADTDTTFLRRMFGLALDRTTPIELRRQLSALFQSLMFASTSKHLLSEEFLRTLRILARDPDAGVRRPALEMMAAEGDGATQQVLVDAVRGQAVIQIDPAEAVRLLGLRDPQPWYPVLREVLGDPPSAEARLEAIRLLGGDESSRPELIRILGNGQEPLEARRAALGALAANVDEMAPLLQPVVADEGSPTELRLLAIQTVEQRRISRDSRAIQERRRDEFDRLMERLAESAADQGVRQAARRYLERTGSAR